MVQLGSDSVSALTNGEEGDADGALAEARFNAGAGIVASDDSTFQVVGAHNHQIK